MGNLPERFFVNQNSIERLKMTKMEAMMRSWLRMSMKKYSAIGVALKMTARIQTKGWAAVRRS